MFVTIFLSEEDQEDLKIFTEKVKEENQKMADKYQAEGKTAAAEYFRKKLSIEDIVHKAMLRTIMQNSDSKGDK